MSEAPNSDATPTQSSSSQTHQAGINAVWESARRALLMVGKSLQTFSQLSRHRDASILGDVFMAAAGAIERRMK